MVPPRSNVMPVASHYAESMCSVGACVVVCGGLHGRLRGRVRWPAWSSARKLAFII